MLINEIINNSEFNFDSLFIINSYNEETGEIKTVYRSWLDNRSWLYNDVPFDICMKKCTMITSKTVTVWGYNCPCIVLEYTE